MKSIKIGQQEWSTKNLCVTHFRNGEPIQEVKNYDDWMNAINSNNPARTLQPLAWRGYTYRRRDDDLGKHAFSKGCSAS